MPDRRTFLAHGLALGGAALLAPSLAAAGLLPGPWLRRLKQAITSGETDLEIGLPDASRLPAAALAAELLRRLDAVADGARENDELIGNAHRLELGPRGARIEALFDSAVAPALLSLAELRRLVSAWIALIERAPDD